MNLIFSSDAKRYKIPQFLDVIFQFSVISWHYMTHKINTDPWVITWTSSVMFSSVTPSMPTRLFKISPSSCLKLVNCSLRLAFNCAILGHVSGVHCPAANCFTSGKIWLTYALVRLVNLVSLWQPLPFLLEKQSISSLPATKHPARRTKCSGISPGTGLQSHGLYLSNKCV